MLRQQPALRLGQSSSRSAEHDNVDWEINLVGVSQVLAEERPGSLLDTTPCSNQ